MWIPLSTVTALCVLLDVAVDVSGASASAEDALEVAFGERTRADWEKVWHQESHSRCREKLIRHLYWACEKDIYRISRRNDQPEVVPAMIDASNPGKRANALPFLSRWTIGEEQARSFLRIRRTGKRRSGGSITAECCTRVGCTWEEYAEYCPSNKRINRYRK
ncbi:probable insulin-like peptide 7 [Toxorhynchites rutilus septentrionalis]|uniref:probable insulin-like peptide 7 n=1 Tax=Toxorhynchites rutilus septentrionalis TaxID=329112 RepID=UPI0024789AED|nr:probable insulin-like peptide 7 [Toxorhynchites rutilus septentrionalis]